VGATGSGKSTLVHLLADIHLMVRMNAFGGLCLVPERTLFAVASGPNSVTTMPGFWHDPNGVVYCDCPGFDDSRGASQEITNAFAIDQLFTEPSRIKILLVTEASETTVRRGGGFKEQLNRLACQIPDINQLRNSVALVMTKILDRRSPAQYLAQCLEKTVNFNDPANGLLRFFAANPDRVFGFYSPLENNLDMPYGVRDGSVDVAKNGIRRFLSINPVINPAHCVSLNDSSLLKLSMMVGDFFNVRFSLQEFADLTSILYREENDIDRLRVWLSAIDDLMNSREITDTPRTLARQIRNTAPFSEPDVLDKVNSILEKIDGFQPLQHFLRQVSRIENMTDGHRRIFAERADLNLFAALNPLLQVNRRELERLIQLAEERIERALVERIGYIVGHFGLDPVANMISVRSVDILAMDILKRYGTVSEIFEKRFVPFQELHSTTLL
jgi:hypothetical protein